MWPIRRKFIAPALTVRGRTFHWGSRTFIMGIINATPDSFSGDGVAGSVERATTLAREFTAHGADIIDIGAESTRPDAAPIDAHEELRRLLPVIEAVRAATDLPISVDTYRAAVAAAALDRGADMVNDIWGLRFDPAMAPLVAQRRVPLVAMHNQRGTTFHDVAGDILTGWGHTLELATQAGIEPGTIILDPGFGFGWHPEHNLEMLRRIPELCAPGYPLLIGTSRKSTIGLVIDRPADARLGGTAATVAVSISAGADIIRVHDVAEMTLVTRMTDAIVRANWKHEQ